MHDGAHTYTLILQINYWGKKIISYRIYGAKDKNQKAIRKSHPVIYQQRIWLPVHFLNTRTAICLPPVFSAAVK